MLLVESAHVYLSFTENVNCRQNCVTKSNYCLSVIHFSAGCVYHVCYLLRKLIVVIGCFHFCCSFFWSTLQLVPCLACVNWSCSKCVLSKNESS